MRGPESDLTDHYVYQARDAAGRLLYVGCTKNLERRFEQHKASRSFRRWWHLMVTSQVDGPYPYGVARAIERQLINHHNPPHNGDSPRAIRYRKSRNKFFESVAASAEAAGETWADAMRQAGIATDIEFGREMDAA